MSWLDRNSSNGIGRFLVQSPPGERKSGMPHSVEIPAPVKGRTTRAASISSRSAAMPVSTSRAIIYGSPNAPRRRHQREVFMRYLHTMLRVRDLDRALDFYCNKLGLKEVRRRDDAKGRYTNVFLAAPEDENLVDASKRGGREAQLLELTYNWDTEDYGEARYFGHLDFEVDDVYKVCKRLMQAG